MNTYEGEMCHKPNAIESDLHYHFVGPASTECHWHIAGSSWYFLPLLLELFYLFPDTSNRDNIVSPLAQPSLGVPKSIRHLADWLASWCLVEELHKKPSKPERMTKRKKLWNWCKDIYHQIDANKARLFQIISWSCGEKITRINTVTGRKQGGCERTLEDPVNVYQ